MVSGNNKGIVSGTAEQRHGRRSVRGRAKGKIFF